jgi:hypothetical protein
MLGSTLGSGRWSRPSSPRRSDVSARWQLATRSGHVRAKRPLLEQVARVYCSYKPHVSTRERSESEALSGVRPGVDSRYEPRKICGGVGGIMMRTGHDRPRFNPVSYPVPGRRPDLAPESPPG